MSAIRLVKGAASNQECHFSIFHWTKQSWAHQIQEGTESPYLHGREQDHIVDEPVGRVMLIGLTPLEIPQARGPSLGTR